MVMDPLKRAALYNPNGVSDLRDWFAGLAMSGLLARVGESGYAEWHTETNDS